jgi:cell division protein ZapA
LVGEITQEHMDEICETVNDMLLDVKKSNPLMNKNMALLLCTLNLSEELKNRQRTNDELRAQIGNLENIKELKEQIRIYKEYADRNNEIYQELSLENDRLKEEMDTVRNTLEQYNIEESRKTILDLQNQLFESQIELVKANKNINSEE